MGLARDRALSLRVELKVPKKPTIALLSESLRTAGLKVRPLPLGPEAHGAWLGRLLVVNSLLPPAEQVWIVGHELGHQQFDTDNHRRLDWIRKAQGDRRAELFAGHLFMADPPSGIPAWVLSERHGLPYARVARWLDLREGCLAISSADADLCRYTRPRADRWRASYEWRTPAQRMAWGR